MNGIREFLQSTMGKTVASALVVAVIIASFFFMRSSLSYSEGIQSSRTRTFVDTGTNLPFQVEVKEGMTIPVKAPSGQDGYEFDETCSWTKDGHVSDHATYVLMNKTLRKPGPTFCPECGRLVVENNPPAAEGVKPPPTKAEYGAR